MANCPSITKGDRSKLTTLNVLANQLDYWRLVDRLGVLVHRLQSTKAEVFTQFKLPNQPCLVFFIFMLLTLELQAVDRLEHIGEELLNGCSFFPQQP